LEHLLFFRTPPCHSPAAVFRYKYVHETKSSLLLPPKHPAATPSKAAAKNERCSAHARGREDPEREQRLWVPFWRALASSPSSPQPDLIFVPHIISISQHGNK
jgi:hypothetical protein